MDEEHHRRHEFSRLFIGLLGIMVGAIMVAAYQCISFGFCNQRQILNSTMGNQSVEQESSSSTVIEIDRVFKYTEGCEKGTCAVCLSDFVEGEEIRVLPECMHAFHAPCVDMWLFSHANCPLCRANTTCLQSSVLSSSSSSTRNVPPEPYRMPDLAV